MTSRRTRAALAVLGVLAASAVGASRPALAAQVAGRTAAVPYTDPAVTGSIGLCDVHGRQVLSGYVTDKPFVWLAVGTSAAGPAYGAPGRTAFLAAYQPRQGVAPGDWSGFQLAAASRYSNPAHPMSQATPASSTLRDFLGRYPAQWDGLVQLRLILSGPQLSARTGSYDATDIRVTGSTWQVVRGGTGPCTAGTAVSTATLLHLPGSQGTPAKGAVASPPPVDAAPVSQAVGPVGATEGPAGSSTPAASSSHVSSGGFGTGLLVGLGVAVLAGGGLLAARRRGAAQTDR